MKWYEQWFQEEYDKIYINRNDKQAADQVNALFNCLSLTADAQVLDVGCGKGRHLKFLQKKTPFAYGIDLSSYLLNQAQKSCGSLIRANMNNLPFQDESFDLLGSFFSSFGYLKGKKRNFQLLRKFSDLVKPGKFLFLDLMNKKSVLSGLPRKDEIKIDSMIVVQDRYSKDDFVIKDITIKYQNGESKDFQERVMVFEKEEMEIVCQENKLRLLHIFGDEQGAPYNPDVSPRMSLVLQKDYL